MIDENEAFWAGLAIAIAILASGFSMLFVSSYTGEGAVILSLGVMTMVFVLMIKVLVSQLNGWIEYNRRIEETLSQILSLQTKPEKEIEAQARE